MGTVQTGIMLSVDFTSFPEPYSKNSTAIFLREPKLVSPKDSQKAVNFPDFLFNLSWALAPTLIGSWYGFPCSIQEN